MRALLDTHAFLWWINDDARLSDRCRAIISSGANEILFSAVSAWEIAVKAGIGRLTIQAISNRDYYLVQGCILAIGLTYVAVNFLTDVLYSVANPRIRQ